MVVFLFFFNHEMRECNCCDAFSYMYFVLHDVMNKNVFAQLNRTQHVSYNQGIKHDDVTKRKHFPRHWPFVWGIHRSTVNSQHKGQRRGALMFSLICTSNKRLSKQSWDWWFETPSRPLWRHCNDTHRHSMWNTHQSPNCQTSNIQQ